MQEKVGETVTFGGTSDCPVIYSDQWGYVCVVRYPQKGSYEGLLNASHHCSLYEGYAPISKVFRFARVGLSDHRFALIRKRRNRRALPTVLREAIEWLRESSEAARTQKTMESITSDACAELGELLRIEQGEAQ